MPALVEQGDPETYAIIGAAMEVHRVLGAGFLEPVYRDALAFELADRAIEHVRELPLRIAFENRLIPSIYRADFICSGRVLVEVKALRSLSAREIAQVLHYLKATRLERALLVNFGAPRLEFKRFVQDAK